LKKLFGLGSLDRRPVSSAPYKKHLLDHAFVQDVFLAAIGMQQEDCVSVREHHS